MTRQENQDTSARVSAFSRSRRTAAAVAFSLGLGSLVYGTLLALPASAAAGATDAPACTSSAAPTDTSGSGGDPGTPTDGASATSGGSATGAAGDDASPATSAGSVLPTASCSPTSALPPSAGPSATDTDTGTATATATATGTDTSTSTATPTATTTASGTPSTTAKSSPTPAPSKSTTPSAPVKGGPTAKPPATGGTQTIPVYVVAPTGSYYVYTDVPPGNAGYQLPHGTISRAQIMARAQLWVQEQVPYSESEWYSNLDGTYRQDCSGYVSMAWDLNQNTDFWTGNLNLVAHTIPAGELLPGDILLSDKHTILFAGWADAAHTSFNYYEESHPGTVAHYVTDAPLGAFLDNGFAPFRYDGVTDSTALPTNPLGVPYAVLVQQGSEVDPSGVSTAPPPSLPSSQTSSSSSAAPNRIVAQAAADDIADSGGRETDGAALGVAGAFLIGAGLLMRRPALQARKRRH